MMCQSQKWGRSSSSEPQTLGRWPQPWCFSLSKTMLVGGVGRAVARLSPRALAAGPWVSAVPRPSAALVAWRTLRSSSGGTARKAPRASGGTRLSMWDLLASSSTLLLVSSNW